MSYDSGLETMLDQATVGLGVEKKRMFGGLCYLTGGNMFGGVYKDFLIARVGEKSAADAINAGKARPFDITGKPMKGWVMIGRNGWESGGLPSWVKTALDYASSLPRKK